MSLNSYLYPFAQLRIMSSGRDDTPLDRLVDQLEPVAGFGRGVSAFLSTYVILVIAWFVEAAFAGAKTGFSGLFDRGLEFTHFAHLGVPGGPLTLDGEPTRLPFLVYALVPAVVLFYHGSRIALRDERRTLAAAGVSGGSVVIGYAIAVAASRPLLDLLFDLLVELAPDLGNVQGGYSAGGWLPLLLFAGVLYPLIAGGLAGCLVYAFGNR